MKTIILSLIAVCLLLVGCGGGGGSSGGSSSAEPLSNTTGDGNNGGDGDGSGGGDDGGNGNGSNGDGGGERLSFSAEVQLSISPFVGGLNIRWHNLPVIEEADGIYIHLNLTGNHNPPQPIRERIAIEDLTDNSHNLTGLDDGIAYRLVEVRVELAGNISRVIDNITWSEPWEAKTNALDQEGNGIVVGANYDGDGRADSEDTDDDNDGVNNTRADGTVWDLCSAREMGELGWQSNSTSDYDGDGCRDDGEDPDDDNDGVDDTRADGTVWDLCSAREMGELGWQSNSTSDYDGDGCRDDGEDPDDDNDGVEDGDEVAGQCVIDTDCDNDGVEDGDEVADQCVIDTDCDSDGDRDDVDIDDDGDGLIEIRTAEELDAVRHVLDGTGFKADAGAMLNQTGCGGRMSITVCNGYELVRDIFLTDYIADNYPTVGWEPIASDVVSGNDGCDGGVFTGTFDGNGFEVRGLFINRPREDCIGLFGAIRSGKILNLGVVADRIIGREDVGSLVGRNAQGKIIGSYAVSSEVRGTNGIGGLMGYGLTADIVHSYAVSSEVRGEAAVGGLVGFGWAAKVVQSYAVSGEVRGDSRVGGLIGSVVTNARIIQSYGVSGEVRGNDNTGGLVGRTSGESRASASYWDTETSSRTNSALGSGQTSEALRMPTDYTDIYATWDDGAGVDGINDNTTIWCDEDASGMIEGDERRGDSHANGDNRVWDFGTATDYPALRCTGDSLVDQRAWWFLNTTSNEPQLNRTRVNAYLDGTLP